MAISIYEPRTMAKALEEMKPAHTFLKRLFFGKTPETSQTEKVDVDVKVGSRRVAPFVNPKAPGKVVDRPGFTTSTYTAPLLSMKRPVTTEDLQTRIPGEHIYAGTDPNDRAARLVGADLAELDELITRREELMCRDALISSAIAVVGDDVNYTITFPRDASLTLGLLAAANRWTAGTADIPAQIKAWRRAIVKLTGVNPDTMLLSAEAVDAFLANTALVAHLNTMRMDLGQIAPEIRESGATYIGQLAGTGIDLWAYDEWYIDPVTLVETPMIPAKTILLGSTKADTRMRYGAVPVKSGESIGLVPAPRVPQSWVDEEPPVRWLKLSSRPLPVPVQNNAFLTAQVIA
jgi:hypothetical protein